MRADTGIRNLKQYFEKLKSDPGSLKNGTDPPGGSSAIVASFIENSLNVNMSQVPYSGYPAAIEHLKDLRGCWLQKVFLKPYK